jgi:hypothetical protein
MLALYACAIALPRQVACTAPPVNATQRALYNSAFLTSPLSDDNIGSLNFELLAIEALLAHQAVDLGELRIGVSTIEAAISNVSESEALPALKLAWQATWSNLAAVVSEEAEQMLAAGHSTSAGHAFTRAWAYGFLSVRLMSDALDPVALDLYNRSVVAFHSALAARPYPAGPCTPTKVPYDPPSGGPSVGLNGYWCRPPPGAASTNALVLAMSGYDGSAEIAVFEQALGAVGRGHSVLVFDGPGQGSVSRFLGLHFTTDWASVVRQVEVHGQSLLGSDNAAEVAVVIWGRSFGGFLAPQAFSQLGAASALIADGGIDDFYQGVLCDLPEVIRHFYLDGDDTTFNEYMGGAREEYLGLDGLLTNGALGFGTATPSELYDALSAYRLNASDYGAIGGRAVLVNDPALDGLLANQSAAFYGALPQPRAAASLLLQLDPLRGSGLHSSVGSSSYAPDAILDWLGDRLPLQPPPKPSECPSTLVSGTELSLGVGGGMLVGVFAAVLVWGFACKKPAATQEARLNLVGAQGFAQPPGTASLTAQS